MRSFSSKSSKLLSTRSPIFKNLKQLYLTKYLMPSNNDISDYYSCILIRATKKCFFSLKNFISRRNSFIRFIKRFTLFSPSKSPSLISTFPLKYLTRTKKGVLVRMGKGKGKIKSKFILFEPDDILLSIIYINVSDTKLPLFYYHISFNHIVTFLKHKFPEFTFKLHDSKYNSNKLNHK